MPKVELQYRDSNGKIWKLPLMPEEIPLLERAWKKQID